MKKSILYIILLQTIVLFSACEDYLDNKESALFTSDQVFKNPTNFQKFVDDIYTYYHYWPGDWACQSFGGLGRIGYSSFEGASDLAEASRAVAGTNASFNLGNWSPSAFGAQVELTWPWAGSYAAIRRCNVVLEKVDSVPGLSVGKVNGYKSEALFARAFFYFELIKRYGGVPYLTASLKDTDNMNLSREPYDTCVAKIVRDLDSSLVHLPLVTVDVDFGRPTLGAALALKAKVLLYAASPLNTEPYDINIGARDSSLYYFEKPNTPEEIQQKWIAAARAAFDVIKLAVEKNKYQLADSAHYKQLFGCGQDGLLDNEIIFSRVDDKFYFSGGKALMGWVGFSDVGASRGYGGAAGTYHTQNLVDMYEMADGSIPISGYNTDESPIINPASGYNEQNMWKNRDPRLNLSVLCNQDQWQSRPVQIWYYKNNPTISGSEMKDAQDYTTTGYLCKKMWPEELNQGDNSKFVYMNWIWFRYSDVLLWYAESMNHLYGPDGTVAGLDSTARWALNRVRNKLNGKLPSHYRDVVATTKEQFQERLMNERAIEFVYEEQRWWDVIRYKEGADIFNKPVYGVRIYSPSTSPNSSTTFEITRRKIENRVFFDYMHKYPIPYTEIEKSSMLKQNPGW
ncbi:MAG TPA: RagB/SusD family nutrient uptake outer membrane protein [Paludibacter sp.]|nr:RagB/SusD family nutrient uptake outer membrane protein [Paludibacter sp.]